jgi:beta-N-acetylhexosaminidase
VHVRTRSRLAAAAFALLALAGCDGSPASSTGAPAPSPARPGSSITPGADPAKQAADLVAKLTDEELVGQVLMPYAYGNDATKVTGGSASANRRYSGVSTPADMVKKYHLGGLILVGWSADDPTKGTNKTTNVDSPAQVRTLTAGLQAASGAVPMLIGTDQEYGAVTRIKDGIVQIPSALALGAAGDPALTENAWKAAGTELAALGINVDFAPDADVLGDQPGGVIGSRSFGSDPQRVAAQVTAAVKGLQAAGVAATAKHFPGHGHTIADSHTNLPALTQSGSALQSGDLPPFVAAIAAGAGLIMSGHLDVRAIDPGVPASFSSKVLIDLLRTQLGFTGVVVTDALNMEPAKKWSTGEAAVRALVAGNDILLMPPSLTDAYKGLLDGLHSGKLPRARLVEAVTRVLTLKFRLAASPQPDMSVVNGSGNRDAARAAAAAAITVFRGKCQGPLVSGGVRVTATSGSDQARQWLEAALKAQGIAVGSGSEVRLMGYGKGSAELSGGAAVTVALDTPYVLRNAPGALVATYSSTQVAMESLAAVIAGKAPARGKSPVPVSGLPRSACG